MAVIILPANPERTMQNFHFRCIMCPWLCLPHLIISYNYALHLSNWRRIQKFGSETSLTVIAELSKEDLLELNHGTLTIIWYQIGQCHFAYTTESLVPYWKLSSLLPQTSTFSTSYQLQLYKRNVFYRRLYSLFNILQWNDNCKKFLS